nr:aminotransferase class III-fold pyridoxal phosphate-dependent enzyme [Chryseobacterium sp. CH21]
MNTITKKISLQERDKAVNWHPYTQMKTADDAIPIVKGKGIYLYDNEGKKYLDVVSSWWVTLHGHLISSILILVFNAKVHKVIF